MEDVTPAVPQCNEGLSTGALAIQFCDTPAAEQAATEQPATSESVQPETPAEQPPDLSPSGLRKLRGQYFTVKHIPLTDCGHAMDVINEPRHRNCENCWWQWLNFHPQLVTTVNEAWQEHGREFIVRLRGKHFAKMFGRYMATVADFQKQENAKKAMDALASLEKTDGNQDNIERIGINQGSDYKTGAVPSLETVDEGAEVGSSGSSGEVAQ